MRTVLSSLFCLSGLIFFAAPVYADKPILGFGDTFPGMSLPVPANAGDVEYLGLETEPDSFELTQINGELILVEALNVHCVHCQMQVPSYRELFRLIEADPVTREKVKMIGIALGNSQEEVQHFRQTYQVLFPVLADPQFKGYYELGISATPFTAYVRLDRPDGDGLVVDTHKGLNTDYRRIHADLKRLLNVDLVELRRQAAKAKREWAKIAPLYAQEEDLQLKVRTAFLNLGGMIQSFANIPLNSGRRVYAANVRRGEDTARLYAVVVSRQSVCDICHDIHFIYIFDRNQQIVGFEPLQITKYGNVLWNDQEAERMRQRLVGQSLLSPRPFDPKLDAVTTATISSAMIFDSLAHEAELLSELREEGVL
ncbi:MAG: redoxin domain-containing protein [Deltaproteobacteria bacterium]|nr:redoxin domain-containing protein [Deltaproteobacteria bacterium]